VEWVCDRITAIVARASVNSVMWRCQPIYERTSFSSWPVSCLVCPRLLKPEIEAFFDHPGSRLYLTGVLTEFFRRLPVVPHS
jgi:hypothetical protein